MSRKLKRAAGGGSPIVTCKHCGTPFRADKGEGEFCCSGCEYVYQLIQGGDLGRYYELKGTRQVNPVGGKVFREAKFPWLGPLVEAAERTEATPHLELSLQGISCVGCVWLVERLFAEWKGALDAVVRATTGGVRLRWRRGECDIPGFARHLQRFGYTLGPPRGSNAQSGTVQSSQSLVWRVGVCAAFAMNAMLFTLPSYLGLESGDRLNRLFDVLTCVFATGAFAVGGSYFIARGWQALRRGALHIDLPIALGLVLAYTASVAGWALGERKILYFDFVAVFAFLMLSGRWFQEQAVERNRVRLLDADAKLDQVWRIGPDGEETTIDPELSASGDLLRIPPGAHLPVRSQLVSEAATLDLAWINGESKPRMQARGEILPAGARNIGSLAIDCQALESWSESLLAALLGITERLDVHNRARARAIGLYLVAVLVVATGGGLAWLLAGSWFEAVQVAVSVLVVSCPCSLGVALPLIEEIGVGALRKKGVFVRAQDVFSKLSRVNAILLDKTGTITLDAMRVSNPEALDDLEEWERSLLLGLAGSSLHPVSIALHDRLTAMGVRHAPHALEVPPHETPGLGIEARAGNSIWRLGRPSWAAPNSSEFSEATCVFSRDGTLRAALHLTEAVRDGAADQIAALASRGYDLWILSGDRTARVHAMADQLGIPRDHALGELSPQGKADIVRQYGGEQVCIVGDGANDSLAFNEAACTGTPAIDRGLLENKSDFYFTGRSLDGIGHLLDTARLARLATRRALFFAAAYNAVAIAICLAGSMNPLLAAVLMPASSVITLAIVWATMRERNQQVSPQKHS